MDTSPTPYALSSEEGEAFWGFGSLWTVKASAEHTGGRFSRSSRRSLPEAKARRCTSIGRTTRRSTSSKEGLRPTSMTSSP